MEAGNCLIPFPKNQARLLYAQTGDRFKNSARVGEQSDEKQGEKDKAEDKGGGAGLLVRDLSGFLVSVQGDLLSLFVSLFGIGAVPGQHPPFVPAFVRVGDHRIERVRGAQELLAGIALGGEEEDVRDRPLDGGGGAGCPAVAEVGDEKRSGGAQECPQQEPGGGLLSEEMIDDGKREHPRPGERHQDAGPEGAVPGGIFLIDGMLPYDGNGFPGLVVPGYVDLRLEGNGVVLPLDLQLPVILDELAVFSALFIVRGFLDFGLDLPSAFHDIPDRGDPVAQDQDADQPDQGEADLGRLQQLIICSPHAHLPHATLFISLNAGSS